MNVLDPTFPTAILKADDLGLGGGVGALNFRRLVAQISERDICVSIGAVASYAANLTHEDRSYFRGIFSSESFELWNHSDKHRDLTTLSYDEQFHDTLLSQDKLTSIFGVRPRVYGAPYNRTNNDTIRMLETIDQFDGAWMLGTEETSLHNIPIGHLCSPEYVRETTRQPEFDEFRRRWASRSMWRPTIVQFHPTAWNGQGFDEFARCIDWLLSQHVRFVTFKEAIDFGSLAGSPVGRAAPNTPARSLTIGADRQAHALIELLPDEAFNGLDRNFFGTRYKLGTQGPMRCLSRSGILYDLISAQAAQGKEKGRVLDVGCGVGDWMIAAAALAPDAIVEGIDKHPGCVSITRQVVDHLELSQRIFVHLGSAESLPFPDSRFTAAFIVNSLNYIKCELAFSECWRTLRPGGQVLILSQTRAYFLRAAVDALRAGNAVAARARFTTLALQAGRSLGLNSSAGAVWTCQIDDLVRTARLLGFDVLVERADVQQSVSEWNGEPLMDALILQRGTRLKFASDILARPSAPKDIDLAWQLIHLGCHTLLLELAELGLVDNAALEAADCLALASLGRGKASPTELSALEGGLRTPHGRAVFLMERRDWSGAAAITAGAELPELVYLHALALYLSGDHAATLAAIASKAPAEPRFAYLAAAAACALGKLDLAQEVATTGKLKKLGLDMASEGMSNRPFGQAPRKEGTRP